MTKQVLQIAVKDVQGNAKAFGILLAILAAMAIALPATQSANRGQAIQIVFLANLNLVNVLASVQWVFATEKQRKTITILKSLPVSTRTVLLGKFAAAFLVAQTIFAASFLSLNYSVERRWGMPVFGSIYGLILFNLFLLVVVAVFSSVMIAFDPKTATLLPLAGGLVLILIWIRFEKLLLNSTFFMRLVTSHYLYLFLGLGFLLIILLAFLLSERLLERREPSELIAE